jgi:hypothetical protein
MRCARPCAKSFSWYVHGAGQHERQPPALHELYGTPEEYFSGLAWQIIGAHPPGLSGGYFGHWRYRPDNEPK